MIPSNANNDINKCRRWDTKERKQETDIKQTEIQFKTSIT